MVELCPFCNTMTRHAALGGPYQGLVQCLNCGRVYHPALVGELYHPCNCPEPTMDAGWW
jgi:hypothetical protein